MFQKPEHLFIVFQAGSKIHKCSIVVRPIKNGSEAHMSCLFIGADIRSFQRKTSTTIYPTSLHRDLRATGPNCDHQPSCSRNN
jgi:hypothetical protein